MNNSQRTALLVVALIIIGGLLYILSDRGTVSDVAEVTTAASTEKESVYPKAREIVSPHGFINSPNGDGADLFTISEYIGKKVVLVDFWTYSCINCIRTQPYLNAWYDKYEDSGLVIIGVHTPEFDFEKIYENVQNAVREEGIRYPVVLDNEYGTWRAYQNSYWPRKYLIDIDGYIVYDHIGEGAYDETEVAIQKALTERAERIGERVEGVGGTVSVESDSTHDRMPRTPEIYFGAFRNEDYLGNGEVGKVGVQTFTMPKPEAQKTSTPYLGGVWNIMPEYARGEMGSTIKLRYQGKEVFFVAASEKGARVRVTVDGKTIRTEWAGGDAQNGGIEIRNEKLYRVVESDEWGTHDLELIIEDGVLDAFTFTFG